GADVGKSMPSAMPADWLPWQVIVRVEPLTVVVQASGFAQAGEAVATTTNVATASHKSRHGIAVTVPP
ncbi:MAG: hypothetical protein U1E23_00065, partial [Reyranellaceae bacterium]